MAEDILVLNPRPKAQAQSWNQIIEGLGLKAVSIPLVESVGLKTELPVEKRDVYNGLFFSSPSALSLFRLHSDAKKFEYLPVYTLSRAVWKKLEAQKLNKGFCSMESSVEGFLKEYKAQGNERWLHPCSTKTRLNSQKFLEGNIRIDNLPIYEPRLPQESESKLEKYFGSINVILYSSGSTVENLWEWLEKKYPGKAGEWLSQKHNLVLGESSADALKNKGLPPGQIYKMGELEKALSDYLNLRATKS